jgi:hypothetical protein
MGAGSLGKRAEQCSEFVQIVLRLRGLRAVAAVRAAKWLHAVGLLRDSAVRPGKPLRDLLRKGLIAGQRQSKNGRWSIRRAR